MPPPGGDVKLVYEHLFKIKWALPTKPPAIECVPVGLNNEAATYRDEYGLYGFNQYEGGCYLDELEGRFVQAMIYTTCCRVFVYEAVE